MLLGVLRVVLDTTALCEDFHLRLPSGARLLAAADAGQVVVHLSPIVIAEAERRFLEDVSAEAGSIVDKLKPLVGGRFGAIVTHDIEGQVRAAREVYPAFLVALLTRAGVHHEDWPVTSHQELVGRDLRLMPPFRRLKEATTGYRDTLVWLQTLDIAQRHPTDDVVLVSANRMDYASLKSAPRSAVQADREDQSSADYELSQKLRDEVARELGAETRVRLVKDLRTLGDLYLAAAEQSATERVEPTTELSIRELLDVDPDARAAVLAALWGANDRIRELDLVPQYNPKEGEYDYPDVYLDIPPEVTDATLEYIEGPFDLAIEAVEPLQGDRVFAVSTRHRVTLRFDGFLDKSDYAVSDDEDIDVLDYDWNDHVMHVAFERHVLVDSSVTFTREPLVADVADDDVRLTLERGDA